MDFINQIASFAQGQLASALIYLLAVVVADFILGVLVAGILTRDFSLRRLADFFVTTLGWQRLIAFVAALFLMYLHGDRFTHAAVATMATFYATSILPDVYDKISSLLFGGKLPLSTNLAPPPAKVA